MQKIIRFSLQEKKYVNLSLKIRQEVFVEEQNVEPEIEYDEFEESSVHYLLFVDNKAIATARWRITKEGIKLERFATLKKYRGKGFSSLLIKETIKDVKPLKLPIYLNSQAYITPLYEKFGFKIEGKMFMEADIEHFKMILTRK
ncbi:MAG: GNAT family N-acetyltransferase [Bacteroidota bacterium]|nr:GNAT family N-acetyltransferase [Bacteroidota bacterium]